MTEKIIKPDVVRKSTSKEISSLGRSTAEKLFDECWVEATERGDKIPPQCTFDYGKVRTISRLAFHYYLHHRERLNDKYARKDVPVFDAREWQKYV